MTKLTFINLLILTINLVNGQRCIPVYKVNAEVCNLTEIVHSFFPKTLHAVGFGIINNNNNYYY